MTTVPHPQPGRPDFQPLTADELVDYLNGHPGSHTAERMSDKTVTLRLDPPGTNLPSRVVGLGWSLTVIADHGRRLVFKEDASMDIEYAAEMNQEVAATRLERNGPTDEEAH